MPIPISILNDEKGRKALSHGLSVDGRAFVFFQDKLGGEISINGTPSSPELSFDITVVELSQPQQDVIEIDRYGFIEIQTMDFHSSYKSAVSNLRDALRLHKTKFPTELAKNQVWASQQVEGPNIANVFKRTFYQTLLKFELSKEGAAAGTILALPESVWESWQPFLGRPIIEQVTDSEHRLVGSDNDSYHGTNAWIFVFVLDAETDQPISPVENNLAAVLKSRPRLYECLDCGRQTSITAGTAMHRSKLPLTAWFWAAHLMATHSNGMSARQLEDQLGVTYKTAWLLTQKLRRSMVDPDREPLEGVVEVDQAEIPFREGDAFFEPGNAGKILVIGAVEVIDRGVNQARPRRKHAKYLDTRSGRIRLARIANNSARSIEAFVKANVKRGTTLITDGHASYPGLTGYRHDPRIVGKMAGHIVFRRGSIGLSR